MHIVRHLVESFGIAATSDPGTGWLAFAGQGPVNEWCLAGHSQKQQELRNKVRFEESSHRGHLILLIFLPALPPRNRGEADSDATTAESA